jgi:hypothetical protein
MGEADRQSPELEVLRNAAAGLLYPSESDAPFDVFSWPAATGGSAREQVVAHTRAGRQVDEVAVDTFFAELEGADDAARFRELRKALRAALTDVHVFRAGSVKVDVYLIGRTRSGAFAGLHTTSVET